MKKSLLAFLLTLIGCGPMSYEDVAKAEKYCKERGMTIYKYPQWDSPAKVGSVTCIASDGKEYPVPEQKIMNKCSNNQWYFDCDEFYIDIVEEDNGTISVFVKNHQTGKVLWVDEEDEKADS